MIEPTTIPPDEFIEQVKLALDHLYDFAYLQRLPLAQQMARPQTNQPLSHQLRRELITAVETLSPDVRHTQETPDARIYNLLHLRYIEGITVQEAANRLGLSTRQAHRSLRRGEESIAAILWNRLPSPPHLLTPASSPPSAQQLSSVQAEMAHLETHLQPTDIRPLLSEAQTAVQPLAQAVGLVFALELPETPVIVPVDTAVARQIFVSVFSRILKTVHKNSLHVRLAQREAQTTLTIGYTPQSNDAPEILDDVLNQLIGRLGWVVRQEGGVDGRRAIVFNLTNSGALILVVDDNEGLVELLDRYLTGHACRVVTATSGAVGLQLAQELIPDALILDVMMPGKSGWEILQTLRSQPTTATIPIIVCSVFNDPDLAYALGASRFLPKPISRDRILETLHELGVVQTG
ncbi:MAG TPA: response regulator [Chloroflexota bacterium]|nr:response regulator [Chloroflexota bacterium]